MKAREGFLPLVTNDDQHLLNKGRRSSLLWAEPESCRWMKQLNENGRGPRPLNLDP